MSLQLVIGRANSGKTNYCFKSIKSELEKDAERALILIVPEQFNLQAQQELSNYLNPGLLKVDVQSFKNLALRVFNELGGPIEPIVDDLGRLMILRKIVEESKKDLKLFKKSGGQIGFMECLNKLITDFEQHQVTSEIIQDLKEQAEETPSLQNKLEDIDIIYSRFMEYIESKFLTNEQMIDVLISKVGKSNYIKNSHIWLDGFYSFSQQQYELIIELLKQAEKVTITLPIDEIPGPISTLNENDFFYERKKAYQKLYTKSLKNKIKVEDTIVLDLNNVNLINKEVAHLEQEYLKHNSSPYTKVAKAIDIKEFRNQYTEVEEIAKKILYLVRENGYRYRDIAIIAGNLKGYESVVKDIFSNYNIPSFIDENQNINKHVLSELIKGTMELINTNWSYNSVFRILRTGLFPLPIDEIDLLENYVIAYGIRGSKVWNQSEPWEFGLKSKKENDSEDTINEIDGIRKKVAKPLKTLEDKIRSKKKLKKLTVKEISIALYEFLDSIEVEATINKWTNIAKENSQLSLAKENEQIWDKVIEILERMVEILGDDNVSTLLYSQILESALNTTKMGMIPPAKDQVIVGDLERSRIHGVKALFIIGANDGAIPKIDDGPGIFSDVDKIKIEETDIEIIETRNQQTIESQFLIYSAITKPSHYLSVSCALADEVGKSMRPSILMYKLKRIFPRRESMLSNIEFNNINTPHSTFGYLGVELRDAKYGHSEEGSLLNESDWGDVYSWYLEQEEWKDKVDNIIKYLFYTNQQEYLDEETAKLLYNNNLNTSVSKLETFRKCAFSYFIKYGIKAKERKLFEFNAMELGTLFHKALEEYPQVLEDNNVSWTEIGPNEIDIYISQVVDKVVDEYGASLKYESGQNRYRISQVKKMTKRAVTALTNHLKQGEFDPKYYEFAFGGQQYPPVVINIDDNKKIFITGTIDRVDIYTLEDDNFVKILDYKSGKQKFDLLEVYHGLQLQLLLYLDAYIKLASKYEKNMCYYPGGVFYFYIDNPIIDYSKNMSNEQIEKEKDKLFRLSGLLLKDKEVANALEEGVEGVIIPANLKKDNDFSARSSVATLEEFNMLMEHTENIIRQLGKDILDGKVSAMPYQLGDRTPCDYCKYTAICQFDPKTVDNKYDRLEKLKIDEIWARISKEQKGEEENVDN